MTPLAEAYLTEAADCLTRATLYARDYHELLGRAHVLLWLCSLALAAGC